jgi:transposase, IS30 family
VARNGPRGRYRALRAQALAEQRARRPKTAKLPGSGQLRALVQGKLERRWSPGQISAWLTAEFGGQAEMQVSHETIYQAIYVQGRADAAQAAA